MEHAMRSLTGDDVATAYELGYDAGRRAGFPDPPECPSWCDEKHGQKIMGGDDWESIDKRGIEVVRCHAKHVGEIAGIGVEIVATTTAQRGLAAHTCEPVLSLDTSGDDSLSAEQASELAALLVTAADMLDQITKGITKGDVPC